MTTDLFPILALNVGKRFSVAVASSSIFVLDTQTGETLASSPTEGAGHAGAIRYLAIDAPYEHIITVGDDKKLIVWRLSDLVSLSERKIPKKASVLTVTQDGQTIIIGDKFGDIFSYPLHPPPEPETPVVTPSVNESLETLKQGRRESVASHENTLGELVLGHASVITSFILTPDEKFIVSSDRDEHVRVSWYPLGWNIERFCLGHLKFVSALCVPSFSPSLLVSGGGDPSLYVWDWKNGVLKTTIPIWEIVQPHLLVKGGRKRYKTIAAATYAALNKEKQAKKAKGKGKGKGKAAEKSGEGPQKENDSGDVMDVDGPEVKMLADAPGNPTTVVQEPVSEPDLPPEEDTLVVQQITSIHTHDGADLVIFTAIGSSAVYYIDNIADAAQVPTVRYVDLGSPVVNIAYTPSHGDLIWVTVDSSWRAATSTSPFTSAGEDSSNPSALVRVLRWENNSFKESTIADALFSKLLGGLNTLCKVQATPAQLTSLDIYNDLVALPKGHEDEDQDDSTPLDTTDNSPAPDDIPVNEHGHKKRGQGAKALARKNVREKLESKATVAVEIAESMTPEVEEGSNRKKMRIEERAE